MRPQILFLDTEFTDLSSDAIIISIALVNEKEEYYYAEFTDTYQARDCSGFVKEFVLPLLFGGNHKKFGSRIQLELKEWISKQGYCVIASDAPSWDMKVTRPLLEDDWPTNLKGEVLAIDVSDTRGDEIFLDEGWVRHNALHDAIVMKRVFFEEHELLDIEDLFDEISDK